MKYTMAEKTAYLKQKKAYDKKKKKGDPSFLSFGRWLGRKASKTSKAATSTTTKKKSKETTRTKGLSKALYGSIGKKATERMKDR